MIYIKLFLTFLKIGAFTFGGGYAMLPLIQKEVLANKWLSETDIINFIAVSESTPGPFAVNIATYVGTETAGILGAFCATLGLVLPSFVIILIIAKFFLTFRENKVVKGCMSGLQPAVIALIGTAVLTMAETVFSVNGIEVVCSSIIFVIMLFLLLKKKMSPIWIILFSAVLGVASGYILKF